ncbi:bifunctional 2-keto-4-hydroxyglutarate aldolase/2-keto-3-deoxy-6-phosphogluconate aldolase [Pelosinus propionicus]|uniref:bifunctional 2-keto-4-hydroxyglutarate aldolase/2-keto-3-deoxy-6-phosphogluconate aldolase n=1 Tax=Pelosinus propionicus TaxID=380084 RepID=UPI000B8152D3|nr:bifunctional 2-keto-4-hydroxyglutarate aldolase/2-keto-3-deoxy-6-phosphogluconate aldolase [Pelosinus propionicus]
MPRINVLQKLMQSGVVAVIRAQNSEQAIKITEACMKGGIAAIEITFTIPEAAQVITDLRKVYSPEEMIIGAGTVLDPETARIAILAGAQYIVSPSLNLETVKLCNRYQVPVMPGAMTIAEVIAAMEAGADIVKIFPGDAFGPSFIKAIKGPIPQAPLMPTGGVNLENVGEWIKAGCVAVGIGGNLTAGAKTGDYQSIEEIAKQFIGKVRVARGL